MTHLLLLLLVIVAWLAGPPASHAQSPDALKALALGATAVALGRPYCYGLALAGERGVREVLENFAADIDLTSLGWRRSLTMPGLSATVGDELAALQRIALSQLEQKCNVLPTGVTARLEDMSIAELEQLVRGLIPARSLKDLGLDE